jgi:hypothetical protein
MLLKKSNIVLIVICIALNACSANFHTAFRDRDIGPGPNALLIDAKQRVILSQHALLDAQGNPKPQSIRRFCSEPSPDVFSVIAQSLSAGGSFGQRADPASLDIALNLAYGSAEQGSTIPRTQTVNMLREMMFRTCERYLSGGYDELELSTQAARDQRIMVSILAIEQLTGAVTPKPVVIAASGGGAAGASSDAIARLDDARKAKDTAEGKYRSALEAYAEENGEDSVCDTIKDKPEADLTDEQKAKIAPCNEKRKALDDAKSELTTRTAAYQELSALARSGGVAVTTTTDSSAPGGLDRAHADAVKDVAGAVEAIVELHFTDATETLLFCHRLLRPDQAGNAAAADPNIKQMCLDFLRTYVFEKQRQLELQTEQQLEQLGRTPVIYDQGRRALNDDAFSILAFDVFWNREQANFTTVTGRQTVTNTIRGLASRVELPMVDCFLQANSREMAMVCFSRLNISTRRTLALGS